MLLKGDKRVLRGWAFYDWANSVHALVITTAIFPLFYAGVTTQEDGSTLVTLFGYTLENTSLINYTGALAFLIICAITPILSGIADYTDNKKRFLQFFCYLGALSTAALYFFDADNMWYGLIFYMLSLIGFWCSVVFYNSYLPLIADRENHDSLSAKGYALGYIGSALLLIICLVLIMAEDWSANEVFPLVGLWWIGFAQITFRRLPSRILSEKKKVASPLTSGFKELLWVFAQMKKTRRLKKYLTAFFIYSMGVQTVMLVAVYFGEKEINWPSEDAKTTGLIISILIIQFIAIGGAYTMAWASKKIGNIKTLMITNCIWVIICITAMFITEPVHFYLEAALVGFVMGGIQSMSRSTYSKFLPKTTDTASFFSFYDVSEKLGIVFGLFTFGLLEELGNMRLSVGSLLVFFLIGLILLFRVPKEEVKLNLDH